MEAIKIQEDIQSCTLNFDPDASSSCPCYDTYTSKIGIKKNNQYRYFACYAVSVFLAAFWFLMLTLFFDFKYSYCAIISVFIIFPVIRFSILSLYNSVDSKAEAVCPEFNFEKANLVMHGYVKQNEIQLDLFDGTDGVRTTSCRIHEALKS